MKPDLFIERLCHYKSHYYCYLTKSELSTRSETYSYPVVINVKQNTGTLGIFEYYTLSFFVIVPSYKVLVLLT